MASFVDNLSKLSRASIAGVIAQTPGPSGDALRARYWRGRLGHLGKGVRIDVGAWFVNPQHIFLEDGCWIDRNVMIMAGEVGQQRITFHKHLEDESLVEVGRVRIGEGSHIANNVVISGFGGVTIGKNCGVASGSNLYSFSHHYRNLTDRSDQRQYSFTPLARPDQQSMVMGAVVIEDYGAIGLNAVLLPATHLKRGTWVASSAVVSGVHGPQAMVYEARDGKTKDLGDLDIIE